MFPTVLVTEKNGATASIYNYGAHVKSWKTSKGREWIFVSKKAKFEQGAAIRGGVPIIFPQFNAFGPGSRHGFARNMNWLQIKNSTTSDHECCFVLSENETTLSDWPYPFKAEFRVSLKGDQLSMGLRVQNTGDQSFAFTCALHTYFKVEDVSRVKVKGLKGLKFWDNDGSDFKQRKHQFDDVLSISGAIDRVYFNASSALKLQDGADELEVSALGFKDVVIWNPGEEAAKNMNDFETSEHSKMLCVEAANIEQAVTLAAGEEWNGTQVLKGG